MKKRVMTAPLAVIKSNGVAIGKIKNLRIAESIRRGRVGGIGTLTPDELAALEWSGSMTADSYLIEFKDSIIPGALNRRAQTTQQFVDNVLLQEEGVTLDIYRKAKKGTTASGLIKGGLELFASVPGCFIENDNMDISEGQIGGRNQSFQYLDPVLYRD